MELSGSSFTEISGGVQTRETYPCDLVVHQKFKVSPEWPFLPCVVLIYQVKACCVCGVDTFIFMGFSTSSP